MKKYINIVFYLSLIFLLIIKMLEVRELSVHLNRSNQLITEVHELYEDHLIKNLEVLSTWSAADAGRLSKTNNKPTLLYFYSMDECSKCIYRDLELIKSFISLEKIIIYPVLRNNRFDKIRIDTDLEGFYYQTIDQADYTLPYYFGRQSSFFVVKDSDGELKNMFVPSSTLDMPSTIYLDYIKNRYGL